jgi:hypothetical protein
LPGTSASTGWRAIVMRNHLSNIDLLSAGKSFESGSDGVSWKPADLFS